MLALFAGGADLVATGFDGPHVLQAGATGFAVGLLYTLGVRIVDRLMPARKGGSTPPPSAPKVTP